MCASGCDHTRGGQRSALGVAPQKQSALFLSPGLSLGVRVAALAKVPQESARLCLWDYKHKLSHLA